MDAVSYELVAEVLAPNRVKIEVVETGANLILRSSLLLAVITIVIVIIIGYSIGKLLKD